MASTYSTRLGAPVEVEMFQEISVSGSHFERGKTYGSRVPALIERSIATYARLFAYRRGLDWNASQQAAREYLPVLQEGAPEILDEIRGIAAGSGRHLDEILALNVRTELMAGKSQGHVHPEWQQALFANSAAGVPSHPDDGGELDHNAGGSSNADNGFASADFGECTTAAAMPDATTTGTTILAQTWDWHGEQRRACVLLRIYESGRPEILTLTEAGMVAKHGMNSEGLAVGLNMMRSKNDGQSVGMPVHVLLRMMLRAKTFDDAIAIPRAHKSAASSCIVLGSRGGSLTGIEITPSRVAEVQPQNGRLAHTNHALDSEIASNECDIGPLNSTKERHVRAAQMLHAGTLSLDDFKAILSDHQGEPRCICRHPDRRVAAVDRSETVCGIIMDLGTMSMHIAPSLPCKSLFKTVMLDFYVPETRRATAVLADSCSLCVPM